MSLGSPYAEEINALERRYFEDSGLKLVNSACLGIREGRELGARPPGDAYKLGRSAWRDGSDGLVVTCVGFRAHEVIAVLETDLGAPVVTSAQATLWAGLRLAGVMASVPGVGKLLSEQGTERLKVAP